MITSFPSTSDSTRRRRTRCYDVLKADRIRLALRPQTPRRRLPRHPANTSLASTRRPLPHLSPTTPPPSLLRRHPRLFPTVPLASFQRRPPPLSNGTPRPPSRRRPPLVIPTTKEEGSPRPPRIRQPPERAPLQPNRSPRRRFAPAQDRLNAKPPERRNALNRRRADSGRFQVTTRRRREWALRPGIAPRRADQSAGCGIGRVRRSVVSSRVVSVVERTGRQVMGRSCVGD